METTNNNTNAVEQAIAEAKAAAESQRTILWDKARLGRFTASEIYKLMSSPKDKTKLLSDGAETYVYAKVAEELTGFEYSTYKGDAVEHGEEYEPAAVAEFERLTGLKVTPVGFIPYLSFAGGSPDGLINLADNPAVKLDRDAGIEVKCPHNAAIHIEYLGLNTSADLLKAKPAYWWQIQSCMLFTGRSVWYFISFSPYVPAPLHIGWIKIEADLEAQARIVAKLGIALKAKTEILNMVKIKSETSRLI